MYLRLTKIENNLNFTLISNCFPKQGAKPLFSEYSMFTVMGEELM